MRDKALWHYNRRKFKIKPLPQNVAERINLVRMQTDFTIELFGLNCLLAKALREFTHVLILLSQDYTGSN